ncbi:MAG: hypothetical protein QM644_12370 [Mobilitalea sp.]
MQTINFEGIMRRNVGKGEPIGKIGATGSGKTTLDEVLALSTQTQELLQIREAEGKGSLITTEVIATDDKAVPEDGLITYGEMKRKVGADVTDDNDLFGSIMYSAAKELDGPEEKYVSKISETLDYYLNHPANDSLAYQIKGMSEDIKKQLKDLLCSFDKPVIEKIYNEMIAKNPKKGQKGKQIFIDLMSAEVRNQAVIAKLWDLVVDIVNSDVEGFKNDLLEKGEGAYINDDGQNIKFMVYITTSEYDEKFRNFILKSEYGSKEYLFENLTLVFRGREDLFENEFKDLTAVGEIDGEAIHVIRLIDTQGILHPLGATVDSEVDRLIDILSVYHCNHVILVSNSYINNTQKDSNSVIEKLLQNCKTELNIHVLYTHFDQRLSMANIHSASTSKFARRNSSVDWLSIYEKTVKEQDEQIELFKEYLKLNDGRKKPVFKSVNRAGLYSDIEKLDDLLEQSGVTYDCATDNILMYIFSELRLDGEKIKVSYRDDAYFEDLFSSNAIINVDALFTNLVACKGKKLYASTVRACNNHWINYGDLHRSVVNEDNSYGYLNIKTEFVREIRNIPRNVIQNVNISSLQGIVLDANDVGKFLDLINGAFKDSLGRYLARVIGQDSYVQGFCFNNKIYKTQYDRFAQMLNYVQTYYFTASRVKVSNNLADAMNQAVAKCILEVISTKCVVVY